jgi:hypothetical protein
MDPDGVLLVPYTSSPDDPLGSPQRCSSATNQYDLAPTQFPNDDSSSSLTPDNDLPTSFPDPLMILLSDASLSHFHTPFSSCPHFELDDGYISTCDSR